MTVKEMMLKLLADTEANGDSPDIDFCDDYDERAYVAYCGNHFSDKALKKYADGFNLPIDEESTNLDGRNGYPIVIVHCEKAKDANALRDLLYSMAGYLEAEEEYDELYPEPEDDEPEPERKMVEVVLRNEEGVLKAKQVEFEDGMFNLLGMDDEWTQVEPQKVLRIIGEV